MKYEELRDGMVLCNYTAFLGTVLMKIKEVCRYSKDPQLTHLTCPYFKWEMIRFYDGVILEGKSLLYTDGMINNVVEDGEEVDASLYDKAMKIRTMYLNGLSALEENIGQPRTAATGTNNV